MKNLLISVMPLAGWMLGLCLPAAGQLAIVPEADPETPATLELVWGSRTDKLYTVEASGDLDDWAAAEEGPVPGTGQEMRRGLSAGPQPQFFRLLEQGEQLLNLEKPADGTRYDSYAEFDGPRWPSSYGAGHVTLWHGGKFGAYSITIDDNNSPDWSFWLNVGETYGWKITWFIILHPYVWDIYNDVPGSNTGYFGTLEGLRMLGEDGHDIQLHGACGSMNTLTAEQYEDHVVRSINVLEAALGTPVVTYAYPCGKLTSEDGLHNYREIIGRHMIGARGTPGGTTSVHLLDYLNTSSLGVNALAAGQPSTAFARIWDKRNFLYSQYRGWGVSLYHGLDEAGEAKAIETLDYVKSREDELWVGSFTDVAKYAQERESSTLEITVVEPDRIEFVVTDRMNDSIFDHPLTVKIRLDASWTGIAAAQAGKPIAARLVEHEGAVYGYIEPVPDRGTVVVTRLAAAE